VDSTILSTDPRVSGDFLFSLIRDPGYTPNLSRQVISVNTRWHSRYGYPFWHLPEAGPTRDQQTLFLNPAVHYMLNQLLVKTDSGVCIASEEIRNHPHDPTQYVAAHSMQHATAEKVAFALAWVISHLASGCQTIINVSLAGRTDARAQPGLLI
jgi:hypothetical protein